MTIGLVATLTIKAGVESEFERLFALQAAAVRASETGSKLYTLLRSRTEAHVYIVMELYEDETALDFHRTGAHLEEFRPKIRAMIAESKLDIYDAA